MKLTKEEFCNANATLASLGLCPKYRYGPIISEGRISIWTLTAQMAKEFNVSHLLLTINPVDPTKQPTETEWFRCRGRRSEGVKSFRA